eukprot:GHVN01079450.1.p3 GENE.GHVN01079450.1~~GHVN01079450.1.p3  ORF type:complete len:105 (-),score=28.95 GHVN01079450.1:2309-2623(-)
MSAVERDDGERETVPLGVVLTGCVCAVVSPVPVLALSFVVGGTGGTYPLQPQAGKEERSHVPFEPPTSTVIAHPAFDESHTKSSDRGVRPHTSYPRRKHSQSRN